MKKFILSVILGIILGILLSIFMLYLIAVLSQNTYANEIKYFLDCVINDKDVEKVKDHELLTVLKILNNL